MSSGLSSTSRIFPAFTRPPRPPSGPSQGEVEGCSPIDGSLGPDPAAVPGDDAPHRRETDAGALEFGRGVQALEHTEQLVRILHVEAGTVVPDRSEEHTSELQSPCNLVCRLLLEKKNLSSQVAPPKRRLQ